MNHFCVVAVLCAVLLPLASAADFPEPTAHDIKEIRQDYKEFLSLSASDGRYGEHATISRAAWLADYGRLIEKTGRLPEPIPDELPDLLYEGVLVGPTYTPHWTRPYSDVLDESATFSEPELEAYRSARWAAWSLYNAEEAVYKIRSASGLSTAEREAQIAAADVDWYRETWRAEVRSAFVASGRSKEAQQALAARIVAVGEKDYAEYWPKVLDNISLMESMASSVVERVENSEVRSLLAACLEMRGKGERAEYQLYLAAFSPLRNADLEPLEQLPELGVYVGTVQSLDSCILAAARDPRVLKEASIRRFVFSELPLRKALSRYGGGEKAIIEAFLEEVGPYYHPRVAEGQSLLERYGGTLTTYTQGESVPSADSLFISDAVEFLVEEDYRAAIEAEPLDWRGWLGLAEQLKDENPFSATEYADHAFALIERCDGEVHALCPKIDEETLRDKQLTWARLRLELGFYDRAAALYEQAFEDGQKQDSYAQWAAVARFAVSDMKAAYRQFKRMSSNPESLEDDGVFAAMLASAFSGLSYRAERDGRQWAAYFHTQNLARVQALTDRHQWPSSETSRKIERFYEALRRQENGVEIAPALSRYALAQQVEAVDSVRRKKYVEAVYHYRMALASDPWWYEGWKQLSFAYLKTVGLCAATYAGDKSFEMLRAHPVPDWVAGGGDFGRTLESWKSAESFATRNCVTYTPGWCDPMEAVLAPVPIRPDCEVLHAP